ncbi:hypothetical protein JQ633_32595 [Bradyrhizobium tropiciagri]|uniref:hypothetical protein n=1 Tax=Bradyrhizobium tropiciagri TaxID=312253 RepID=UPI001BA5D83D|nr:hypothetical protein [Bradyrhizobium tropiciagri]MBR0875138.1 hypothetical protein [Bradyrhizobium tropiciagri]
MSSSTFSSKHWLFLFLSIVAAVVVTFAVASEWMLRVYVAPHDNFEQIASRLVSSSQPNAAFGDSHVYSVRDYNAGDFINLGTGATTIRKMNDRVRFYYRSLKPGQVIIQADPHSFAEYRLEAQGSYVPETYSNIRLRILDPTHRGFMSQYWLRLLTTGKLTEQPPSYDQLWAHVGGMLINQAKTDDAPAPAPAAAATSPGASPAGARPAAPTQAADGATKAAATAADPASRQKVDQESLAAFNALMEFEVTTHTPAANFRERDEARIYRDLIAFLVSRGAKVCLVNYPVDRFYRERADRIPGFAETRKFYQEVARANGIPYVSFWDRFDDLSMFQNTDHVNEKGSAILAGEAREKCFGKAGSG